MQPFIKMLTAACLLVSIHAQAQNAYINSNQSIDSINRELAKNNKPMKAFDLQNRRAGYFFAKSEMDSLEQATTEMLKLAQELHSDSALVITYSIISNLFTVKGNYTDGLEWLFKGLRVAEKINDEGYLCSLNIDAGWAYGILGDYENALKYVRRAIEFIPGGKFDKTNLPLQAYAVAAETFYLLKQPDSALLYNQKADEANRKWKDDFQYASVLGQFGDIYSLRKEYDLAEVYYKRTIRYCDSLSYAANAGLYGYANMLLATGNVNAARSYAVQALKTTLSIKNYFLALTAADLNKKIQKQLGNKDSVYYYSMLKDGYNDSVNAISRLSKLQDITLKETLHDIEEEGRLLQQEEAVRENIQYSLIALALVSFVIIFFLFSHSIIANPKLIRFLGVIALLIVFEFLNLLLHPWLSSLTHHSPILMLIAMVCLASLLIPLHHRMEHWISTKLVEKNRMIRLTAAKKTIAKLEG
jgi:tetratricopeptide (TPR) repeat protein